MTGLGVVLGLESCRVWQASLGFGAVAFSSVEDCHCPKVLRVLSPTTPHRHPQSNMLHPKPLVRFRAPKQEDELPALPLALNSDALGCGASGLGLGARA